MMRCQHNCRELSVTVPGMQKICVRTSVDNKGRFTRDQYRNLCQQNLQWLKECLKWERNVTCVTRIFLFASVVIIYGLAPTDKSQVMMMSWTLQTRQNNFGDDASPMESKVLPTGVLKSVFIYLIRRELTSESDPGTNSNESFDVPIWARCHKHKHHGYRAARSVAAVEFLTVIESTWRYKKDAYSC